MAKKIFKPLKASEKMNKILKNHYLKAKYLPTLGKFFGYKTAWITSGAPVELLRAFGIEPVYPENYGAICGARKVSPSLCQVAENRGYSLDLCSYAKSNLGSIWNAKESPFKGLPRPDLLVVCNNICGTVLKWYETLSREFNIPLFIINTPFITGEPQPWQIQYVAKQIEKLAIELEKFFRKKLDLNRLEKVILLANETVDLWKGIRNFAKNKPSPVNVTDLFINLGPMVVLRGTEVARDFYEEVYREVEERYKAGIPAVEGEKYRLVWDNIPIWYGLYRFYGYFAERGAVFVTDSYTGGWAVNIKKGPPFYALAETYTGVFLNRDLEFRKNQLQSFIEEFSADGFVMHSNRSCKAYSFVQEEIRRQIMKTLGVPGLIVDADMTDSRLYSEETVLNRVQAFLESL
ncbi:2-hydroxyacyl-CoA dehydratase subunit D [Carboxydothermus ferrireducens]|uniref:Benzoyl-CoA reductase/2-hydroxyglutaryl-CoA dehydratase subunit BcrC/BadD/HgdB n=1 Tax=Carboxydothermus ferrireducens DSM 11255 TaxID=1119529 RepID=A0ABX2R6F1_9THEO|nr:2-hydroxyacyl-CoA dehydratase family protein [Carboxydothermus ferrireducens]NYE56747.1 benzoyl-CoA reductase/2-hydroxyglutaryl-CoA dehydratase subunit BcrC/BadD/HgdB [Carboxydothermus ferrireducens DSM 11255]